MEDINPLKSSRLSSLQAKNFFISVFGEQVVNNDAMQSKYSCVGIHFYRKSTLIFHYKIVVKIKCLGILDIQGDSAIAGCEISKQFLPVVIDAAISYGDDRCDFSSTSVNDSLTTVVRYL